MRVAIIGGGIGGLTAALALARHGIAPQVFEAAPALGEVGAGITISPNAGRVLDWLGLGERVRAEGVLPGNQHIRDLRTGRTLRTLARDSGLEAQYAAPYRHLHRADLVAMLSEALEALAPGAVQTGRRLTSVTASGTLAFADGSRAVADVVVGADGVRSAVRDQLFATGTPQFTGQVAWRGLVPTAALGGAAREDPPGIHIGPGRLVLRYPLRAGQLTNYAIFVETEGWQEESWSIPSTRAELLSHLPDACPGVTGLVEATPEAWLFKWALFAREPLATWVAGRVTLLGDAAHAMLPFMGQGAATAIEDAAVLARALAALPPEEALPRYEAARRERTSMVQLQSRLLGLQFQGRDPEALGRGPLQNEEALGLFAYDATAVPF
ncbi:MAG: FAD-dependent monooxygenase [Sphingomonadaceae bacterium]